MRAHISDKAILQSIAPIQILTYLRGRSAKETDKIPGKATIWKYSGAELLVPLSAHFADYAMRVAELLSQLERAEDRSQLSIFEDIRNSGFDVIRVRNISEDTRQGTLNLLRSVAFVANARDMLMAAACSAATHKVSYLSKRPRDAEKFMEGVRFGKTEQGSFVLQLLAPVTPELRTNEGTLDGLPEEEPYEHRVVPTLQSGLDALNKAAQSTAIDHDLTHFTEAAPHGLTSNLCDAVVGMYDSLNPQRIEVSITYSADRRQSRSISRISVDPGYIPLIREASDRIKEREPEEVQLVRGKVIHLKSDDPDASGNIVISDLRTARPRRLNVALSGEDYKKAVSAHKNNQLIELSGTVSKEGNSYHLVPDEPLVIFEDSDSVGESLPLIDSTN